MLAHLNLELRDADFDALVDDLDPNGSGTLDYVEFMTAFGGAIAGGVDTGALSRLSNRKQGYPSAAAAATGLAIDASTAGNGRFEPGLSGHSAKHPHWSPRTVDRVVGEMLALRGPKTAKAFRDADKDKVRCRASRARCLSNCSTLSFPLPSLDRFLRPPSRSRRPSPASFSAHRTLSSAPLTRSRLLIYILYRLLIPPPVGLPRLRRVPARARQPQHRDGRCRLRRANARVDRPERRRPRHVCSRSSALPFV